MVTMGHTSWALKQFQQVTHEKALHRERQLVHTGISETQPAQPTQTA